MNPIDTPRGAVEDGGGGTVRIVFRREFDEPVTDVWAAVTEPDRLARWIGTWSGTPGIGKTIQFAMTAEGQVDPEPVTIVACDPPHRLVLDKPDAMDGQRAPWRFEITLDEVGSGTVLTFVHQLADPASTADMGAGWQYYLDRLAASLADGQMPEWDGYLDLADHYRAPAG